MLSPFPSTIVPGLAEPRRSWQPCWEIPKSPPPLHSCCTMSLLIFPGTGLDRTPGRTPLARASGTRDVCSAGWVRAADWQRQGSSQTHSIAETNQLGVWRSSKIPAAESAVSRLQLPRLAGRAGKSWRLVTWWHPGPSSIHHDQCLCPGPG